MRFVLAFLALPLALGCNGPLGSDKGIALQDTLSIDLFGPPQDAINTPYVAGAKFDIDVVANGYDTKGWKLTSSDPTVLGIQGSAADGLDRSVIALRPGHAVVSVVDAGGSVLHSHDVDVEEPDRVELHSHGLMLAGVPDAQSQLSHVDVVGGGSATLLVRYFKGSQELWGNGAVTTSANGPVVASTTRSSLGDARDWVEIDATQLGSAQVTLAVGGSSVAVVPVNVVDATAIAHVEAMAQSESNAQDGQSLYVFAHATNAQGGDVYGASFGWTIDGAGVAASPLVGGPTDLFVYRYTGSHTESVTAGTVGLASSVTVHGKGGSIDTTKDVGCSVARAPGAGAATRGSAVALAFAGLAAVAARRRRVGAAG